MLGSARLPALHHRDLASMSAGRARLACNKIEQRDVAERCAFAVRRALSKVQTIRSARRTHARETAARERVLRRSFPPRGRPSSAPRPSRRRARPGPGSSLLETTSWHRCRAAGQRESLRRISQASSPREKAEELRAYWVRAFLVRSCGLFWTGFSARRRRRAAPRGTPSAASGAASCEERGPGISPGEPSGPWRS
eukprot:tig00000246_g21505.t1